MSRITSCFVRAKDGDENLLRPQGCALVAREFSSDFVRAKDGN